MSNLILGFDIATFVLVFLCLIFLVKNREFEKSEFENSINVFLFGLLMMIIVKFSDVLVALQKIYPEKVSGEYIGHLTSVSGSVLLPLFGVCVLLAVIFVKDAFENLS